MHVVANRAATPRASACTRTVTWLLLPMVPAVVGGIVSEAPAANNMDQTGWLNALGHSSAVHPASVFSFTPQCPLGSVASTYTVEALGTVIVMCSAEGIMYAVWKMLAPTSVSSKNCRFIPDVRKWSLRSCHSD